MKQAKLLDCTLRDGAYLVDKTFGDEAIHGIVQGLVNTGIEFIEIGFFQDEGFGEGKTVYKNSADAKRFVPNDKKGCEFTVLADYSRYDVNNLDAYDENGIDAIRECFFKEERFDAIEYCRIIKSKGYKVFVQPVDILGYTDKEIIEFIELINEIEPYCLSIVDTFGSMYQEDLHRLFELINHNLIPTCRIGFHSHNNLQLSSALSQEFIRLSAGKRETVVDGTLSGMGRGAGNTPTELVAQYMISKHDCNYDIDALLDTIDTYMDNIRSRCTWGYSTPGFIAGCYGAHMNNISYLTAKTSIRYKDIRYILNKIGGTARKRYDYELLEQTYIDYLESNIDDMKSIAELNSHIKDKKVLLLAPGSSCITQLNDIRNFIAINKPIIISVNFVHELIESDYVFISNVRRFRYWKNSERFMNASKILTSNLTEFAGNEDFIVSYTKLLKCGWEHMDNAMLLLLRLLDNVEPAEIYIAGFDGYGYGVGEQKNYSNTYLELESTTINPIEINKEIGSMMKDYFETRIHQEIPVELITTSRLLDYMN